jgi:3-hydroxyisobutyrate dehydrogenase-like beta-hydroxyacid dehydrogenase
VDRLLSQIAHVHLVTCPVSGLPPLADKAELLMAVSGNYRARKEVSHLLVPAMARKVVDLGENPEKGALRRTWGTPVDDPVGRGD